MATCSFVYGETCIEQPPPAHKNGLYGEVVSVQRSKSNSKGAFRTQPSGVFKRGALDTGGL